MGGVTPNGIRYPDGTSKAKNLGPELKTMAEDIDGWVGSHLDPNGPLRDVIEDITDDLVPPLVEQELTDARIVRFGDPAIPEEGQFPDNPAYALRELDAAGKMTRGIYSSDGTQYLPLARVDELKLAASAVVGWGPIGSGVAFSVTDAAGRMSDLSIGDDGRFMPHVIQNIVDAIGGDAGGAVGYDIVICFGQSNSAEADYLRVPGLHEQDTRLYKWEGSAIVPLPAEDAWLGAEFIRAYARHTARTGRRVLVVPAGVGSVGFTSTSINPPPEGYFHNANGTLDRTLTADPLNRYSMMLSKARAARTAAGTGSQIVAMLWSQGESDSRLTEAQYAAKLDDLITQARADLGVGDMPVIIGSMTPEVHSDHEGIDQIARALADTPRRVERTGFVYGPYNGHRYFQTVHFSYAGQIERAGRMAVAGWREAHLNAAAIEPVMPQNLEVERTGGTAILTWDRPLCRVTSLTVEYSTNGGASWSAATLDQMHGSRATAAVAAGTAVRFRITVTNAVGTTMPAEITR